MPRLLFEKRGRAVWISHLDLMRLFQRAFKRAGLLLKHTQGFNPRPSVSIALPLSVGVESGCELLDFELEGNSVSCDQVRELLNTTLTDGLRVLDVYESGQKIKFLSILHCKVTMEYDATLPDNAQQIVERLFSNRELILPKKTKSGIQDQDIIPMIRKLEVRRADSNTLELDCRICCQNPSLNPAQLSLAVATYLPELAPSFARCERIEVYDFEGSVFR